MTWIYRWIFREIIILGNQRKLPQSIHNFFIFQRKIWELFFCNLDNNKKSEDNQDSENDHEFLECQDSKSKQSSENETDDEDYDEWNIFIHVKKIILLGLTYFYFSNFFWLILIYSIFESIYGQSKIEFSIDFLFLLSDLIIYS